MLKKVIIISLVKKLAHGVKTILNNGPHQESAAELLLAMVLLFFRSSLCVYTQGMELAQDT